MTFARRVVIVALVAGLACPLAAGVAPAAAAKSATRATSAKPAKKAPKKQAKAAAVKPAPAPEPVAAPAPPTTEEWWKRARALADQRRFDEALETVGQGLGDHPGDTQLLWLEAGLLGEAGRHPEAVAHYEQLVASHPEMARDLRGDLATQRLWAGDPAGAVRDFDLRIVEEPTDRDARRLRALALAQLDRHAEALAAYDSLLAQDPNDREALLGRARLLTWMGRHTQATAAYEAYLANHPADPEARLALAQNVNWSGDHRRAARMFEDLRRENASDPEAAKGLAWAEYWSGRPDESRAALGDYLDMRPNDREGEDLARLLARDESANLRFGVERSDDSDELRIVSRLVEYRQPFGKVGTATFFLRRDELEDPGGSREPFQLGAALDHRWSVLWSGHFMAAYLSPGDGADPTGLYEADVTCRPDDRWRLDAGLDRSMVLTREAQSLGIFVRTFTLGADWHANSRVMLHADQRLRAYSDDNHGATRAASVRAGVYSSRKLEAALGFGVEHLTTDDNLDHGYYDPEWYTEYGPAGDLEWRPRERWALGAAGKVGRQHEQGSEIEPFHTYLLTAEIPISSATFHLSGGRSNSNLSSDSGFRQKRWSAYLSFGF